MRIGIDVKYLCRSGLSVITALLTISLLPTTARAAEPVAPFVAGFDRFAPHGDIEPGTAGRLLLSELSCTACHATDDAALQPKRGPRLSGAGNRLRHPWIEHFLRSPHDVKPGTTMPDVLATLPDGQRDAAARALSAFLASQQQPFPEIKAGGADPVPHEFWNKGSAARGEELYHQVGCVACHDADEDYEVGEVKPSPIDELLDQLDPEELAELGLAAAARRVNSVPHPDLPAKYTKRALTLFLLNPAATRPAGRMPSLKLQAVEAADIAAYLLQKQTGGEAAPQETNAQLVAEGRRFFGELGCANCHNTNDKIAAKVHKPLTELNAEAPQNCLASAATGLPQYRLDGSQQSAIRAALESSSDASPDDASAAVAFHLLQMNCYACHERNQRGGVGRFRKPYFETVGHIDLGDEGRLPPPLTGIGYKLREPWLKKVLAGQADIRPHMHIRMPQFPAPAVAALPQLLAQADAADASPEKEIFGGKLESAEVGRQLMDIGCVQCHEFRGEALPGTVGVDLAGIAGRVHPQWFREFVYNPGVLKERTRMPTFFPGGKSPHKDLLDGDPHRQIAAMWSYLKQLEKQPLPDKIEEARSQNFELIPQDRPIVLRTFMKAAGTHAVAVGFPQEVHFAFDAEQIRPAVAWRGRFLDSLGTWFVRFAPPAEPLGDALISLPPGAPFAMLEDNNVAWPAGDDGENRYRFSGYRLDADGVPTFLYRYGPFDIEDRIAPADDASLTRHLTITPARPADVAQILFRPQVGTKLSAKSPAAYTNERGLTVTIPDGLAKRGTTQKAGKQTEWIVPINVPKKTTIEVKYAW